jgi:hypothetical protein
MLELQIKADSLKGLNYVVASLRLWLRIVKKTLPVYAGSSPVKYAALSLTCI